MAFADELRLLWFTCLNAIVVYSAWRIATRLGTRSLSRALLDTMLFSYLFQYLVVCALGAVGLLSLATLSLTTALIGAGILALTARTALPRPLFSPWTPQTRCAMAILLFAAGYLFCYSIYRSVVPVFETDALAYHLPTAIGWLQTGRLTLFESWYWNPANTYSPLAAEAFMAWLLAPMQSDVFVRFVQTPALLMVGLALYRIGRAAGATPVIAACVSVSAMLSRSMFAQATLVKDDLFVAAFFITAIACFSDAGEPDAATGARAPIDALRIGIVLGLLIATKYTASLTLPLVLLALDVPLRTWRTRNWIIAFGTASFLAAPWFLRNWIEFGNPLFPMILKIGSWTVFQGNFNTWRAASTRTPQAIWAMVSQGYFGTSPTLLIALAVLWAMAVARFGWQATFGESKAPLAMRPVLRLAVLGPLLGPVVFSLASPLPEIRYFLPFLMPLFVSAWLGLRSLDRWPRVQIVVGFSLAAGAMMTSFAWVYRDFIFDFALGGGAAAAIGWGIAVSWTRAKRLFTGIAALAGLALLVAIYVEWHAYTEAVVATTALQWNNMYGDIGQAWMAVRDQLPGDATVAYVNTNLVYPLYGPHYRRRVVYAPVRRDERSYADLPQMGDHVPQNRIAEAVTAAMNDDSDEATWLKNLKRLGVEYVFIAKHERSENPPELHFARDHPERFDDIFENNAALIFRVNNP